MNWEMGEPVETFPARFLAEAFAMPQKNLVNATDWQFIPPLAGAVLNHLRSVGAPLKKHINDTVYRGITTGLNMAFELTDTQRAELISEHASSEALIKPLLKGKDLKRWLPPEATRWIIFTRRGVKIDEYPAIKRHLMQFKDSLAPKPKGRGWAGAGRKPGSYQWFEIQDNVNYWKVFEDVKIISNKVTDKPNFSIDRSATYLANTAYCFNCDKPEFIAGILNSSTSLYVSRRIFADKEGGFYEVQPDALLDFPIPHCNSEDEVLIVTVVCGIIAGADRLRLEPVLNAFVYELFFPEELAARGLTPFAVAREAGLEKLAELEGEALARAADEWSAQLADPATKLYATLFDLQSIDAIRIIEGRG